MKVVAVSGRLGRPAKNVGQSCSTGEQEFVFCKFIESFTLLYRNRKSSYTLRDRYKDGQVAVVCRIEMTG